jgi:hypothetical protein
LHCFSLCFLILGERSAFETPPSRQRTISNNNIMPEVASERRAAELEEQLATMRAQVRRMEMSIDVLSTDVLSIDVFPARRRRKELSLSYTSSLPLSSSAHSLIPQAEAADINAQQAASVS